MAVNKRTGSPFWYIQFQYNGQNYIKSSKTTDKKLAVKQEVQWRNQLIEQQQLGYKQSLSIKEAFQLYANSKSELISYRNINLWCQRAIANWRDKNFIHEVTSGEVERYRNKLSTASYSNQTIKHALNQVSGTIQFAKRMGYQVSEVQMPTIRLSKGRLNYLSAEDEQRLLAELEPTRAVKGLAPYDQRLPELQKEMQDIYDFVIVLLDTGARHTEISSMRWDAVNLDDGTIRLWRPKVQNQSVLFMSHRVHAILTRRKQAASGPFIFTNSKGDARQYLSAPFRRAFDRAGLPNCSAHTLRHTHATRLIQNGLNLYEVKEILGHADIKTTMRYAHLEQAKVSQKAVDVINLLQQSQK